MKAVALRYTSREAASVSTVRLSPSRPSSTSGRMMKKKSLFVRGGEADSVAAMDVVADLSL
jgi:hypothetical protein